MTSVLRIAVAVILGLLSFSTARAEELPLEPSRWVTLSFDGIPQSQVVFENDALKVRVDKSAGPIVFKLDRPQILSGFHVKARLVGSKKIESSEFDEDSVLRVGLVATGDKTLSGVRRLFAADWVKRLFALAPLNTGLDKIRFFNVSNRAQLIGKSRVHPKSDLIAESVTKIVEQEGSFEMKVDLEPPLEVAALWLSVDGDDTASRFETQITSILLTDTP